MCKAELLVDSTVLVNVFSLLLLHIKLPTINFIANHVPKVEQLVYPGQGASTQYQTWQISWLVKKCHALSFTFLEIFVSGELEVVCCSILLACVQHILHM